MSLQESIAYKKHMARLEQIKEQMSLIAPAIEMQNKLKAEVRQIKNRIRILERHYFNI